MKSKISEKRILRLFGGFLAAVLWLWSALLFWVFGQDLVWSLILIISGILLAILACFTPLWLDGFYRNWVRGAEWINKTLTYILMVSVYLMVFLPIGLIRKVTGKSGFQREGDTQSGFRIKSQPIEKSDMENPY